MQMNIQYNEPTIFVSIASFIDPDIRNTIINCIHQSKNPKNIIFGVVLQYNNEKGTDENCIDDLVKKYNIRIKKFWYEKSEGGCWARNQVSYLYDNEDYILQIDAHIRLIKNWDEFLINEHKNLKKIVNKPIISYLSPSFLRNEDMGIDYMFTHIDNPYILNVPKIEKITNEYWPIFQGYTNQLHTDNKCRNVSLLYAGFVFAEGKWITEVRNDPEHYYTGEEFALSIRSFTNGYDIFQPSKIVSWHKSYAGHKNHYHVFNNNHEKHRHAMSRLKSLIEGDYLGEYGLGNIRTLNEYEKFANIDIKKREIYQ